jgi:hypothetical protein
MKSAKVLMLMESAQVDPEFFVSSDGRTFTKVTGKASRFPTAINLYGYKLPVTYEVALSSSYFKIAFLSENQISRIEIRYGGSQ